MTWQRRWGASGACEREAAGRGACDEGGMVAVRVHVMGRGAGLVVLLLLLWCAARRVHPPLRRRAAPCAACYADCADPVYVLGICQQNGTPLMESGWMGGLLYIIFLGLSYSDTRARSVCGRFHALTPLQLSQLVFRFKGHVRRLARRRKTLGR